MKPLLDTNSPLYLKRLVRELNSQEHGFYCSEGVRYHRARLYKGDLQAKGSYPWARVSKPFSDAYGREIVASRS